MVLLSLTQPPSLARSSFVSLTWSSLCLSLSLPIPPFLSSLAISPFLTLSLLSLSSICLLLSASFPPPPISLYLFSPGRWYNPSPYLPSCLSSPSVYPDTHLLLGLGDRTHKCYLWGLIFGPMVSFRPTLVTVLFVLSDSFFSLPYLSPAICIFPNCPLYLKTLHPSIQNVALLLKCNLFVFYCNLSGWRKKKHD